MPGVRRAGQPGLDLGVEVERRDEAATGQERGLEVAVAALDQPLGLRVPSRGELDPHPECPGERGGLGAGLAGPADRGLAVPQPGAGAAAPPADDLPHPGQDVAGLARGDHHRVRHPRVPTRHRQHRQHPRSAPPTGIGAGGNHRSHWATSPGEYSSGRRGRAARTTAAAHGPGP